MLRAVLVVGAVGAVEWPVWRNASDIPADPARRRLERNWAATGEGCGETRDAVAPLLRERSGFVAAGPLAEALGVGGCGVACLGVGAPVALLGPAASLRRWAPGPGRGAADLARWFGETCASVEVGWLTYGAPATLYWLPPRGGRRVFQARLRAGEAHTHWQRCGLGHAFAVVDDATGAEVARYVASRDAIHVVVPAPRPALGRRRTAADMAKRERETRAYEERRARNVRRSWTATGYARGALPPDLWADVSTYWHNNRHSLAFEEWGDSQDAYVNWWDAPPSMCFLPFGLKGRWHAALRALVEAWLGGNVDLEPTDLYGIRSYPDGATLTPHVDRETTHAASVIVNVAQYGMREPWHLQIKNIATGAYDAVAVAPGEVLYYESARCLHGRVEPLRGDAYASLFAHYRPAGDPGWYRAPNPPGDAPLDRAAWGGDAPYDLGDPHEQAGVAGVRAETRRVEARQTRGEL